jgi:hypothetical protein
MPLVRHKIKRYGWIADTPDQRDHLYAAPVIQLKNLPPNVDLRPQCQKVIYDQGQLGSCTGNAIACAIQFDRLKQRRKPDFIPSRIFIDCNHCVAQDLDQMKSCLASEYPNLAMMRGVVHMLFFDALTISKES